MQRRDFLKTTLAAGAALADTSFAQAEDNKSDAHDAQVEYVRRIKALLELPPFEKMEAISEKEWKQHPIESMGKSLDYIKAEYLRAARELAAKGNDTDEGEKAADPYLKHATELTKRLEHDLIDLKRKDEEGRNALGIVRAAYRSFFSHRRAADVMLPQELPRTDEIKAFPAKRLDWILEMIDREVLSTIENKKLLRELSAENIKGFELNVPANIDLSKFPPDDPKEASKIIEQIRKANPRKEKLLEFDAATCALIENKANNLIDLMQKSLPDVIKLYGELSRAVGK